jgi:hypothetical protein
MNKKAITQISKTENKAQNQGLNEQLDRFRRRLASMSARKKRTGEGSWPIVRIEANDF